MLINSSHLVVYICCRWILDAVHTSYMYSSTLFNCIPGLFLCRLCTVHI